MKYHTVELLDDRVLVRPDAPEEKTKGGIHIPDTAKARPETGYIYGVGPGKPDHPTRLEKGQRVIFGRGAGYEITLNKKTDKEEELLLMRAGDILGVIKEEEQ